MPPYSIQQRLLQRTIGGVLVVWLATAAFVWVEVQHELDELLDAHLAQSAALLVVQQSGSTREDHLREAPSLHKYAQRVAYQVFEEGRLVLRSPNASLEPFSQQKKGYETIRMSDGKSWRIFASPGQSHTVQIFVAERVDSREEILQAVMMGFLPPLTMALPLLLIGLWWNVRSGLQPLQRLRQALLKRDTQTFTPLTLPSTPKEVQPMLEALNALLLRLAKRMDIERRFTADAAHELRTPIAAIRAQAQVAMSDQISSTSRKQALQDTLAGCDRAARVVDQLLTLAQVEKPSELRVETFCVVRLIQQVVADFSPDSLRRRQSIELLAPDRLLLEGQSTLWHILLRNLVDNAVRYSPSQARLLIQVQQNKEGQIVLSVEDSGPGLATQDMQRLGERFFRLTGNEATGSGLGWSIIRRIASLQHIAIEVDTSPRLGGLRVTLRHPGQRTT